MDRPHDSDERAPELVLPGPGGERFSLEDLRGTCVLVSFLSHAA